MANKTKPKIEFSCISFFVHGKCPKQRWNTSKCPFNVIKNGNKECIHSGLYKMPIDKRNKIV